MQETHETSALAAGEAQTSQKYLREAAWLQGSLVSHPAAVLCQSDTATLGCVCQKPAGTSLSHFPPGGLPPSYGSRKAITQALNRHSACSTHGRNDEEQEEILWDLAFKSLMEHWAKHQPD